MAVAVQLGELTLASIHARSCCSKAAQPAAEYPELAQHPSILDMMLRHGFASALSGFRIRSFGKGGSFGVDWTAALDRASRDVFPATMLMLDMSR